MGQGVPQRNREADEGARMFRGVDPATPEVVKLGTACPLGLGPREVRSRRWPGGTWTLRLRCPGSPSLWPEGPAPGGGFPLPPAGGLRRRSRQGQLRHAVNTRPVSRLSLPGPRQRRGDAHGNRSPLMRLRAAGEETGPRHVCGSEVESAIMSSV